MKPKVAFIFVAVILPGMAWAQQVPANHAASAAAADQDPKMELSLDYSYAHFQAIDYETPNFAFGRAWQLQGGGAAFTYNFAPLIGIRGDVQYYATSSRTVFVPPGNPFLHQGGSAPVNGDLLTYMGGPQIGLRRGVFRPYVLGLAGGAYSNVYKNAVSTLGFTNFSSTPSTDAFAAEAGLGLDIAVNRRLSIRAFQMSYLYSRFQPSVPFTLNQHSWRGEAGVVVNMGISAPVPVTLACAVQPSSVFPGDPVTITATAANLSTNKNNSVIYEWSGTGVTGNGPTATVATGALAPGNYTVSAIVKQGKRGK